MQKADIFSNYDTDWISDVSLASRVIELAAKMNDTDTDKLLFKCHGTPEEEIMRKAILQIECRRRFNSKLPSFCGNKDFLFPSRLSGEQASSEAVALLHTRLIESGRNIPSTCLDMTAGLGADSIFLSSHAHLQTISFELDPLKAVALRHNAAVLKCPNLEVRNADSLDFIKSNDIHWDYIFADPARRGINDKRVYSPSECLPDVVSNNSLLLSRCDTLFIKHSPMLDVAEAMVLFPHLRRLHLISLRGECKEVLTEQQNSAEFEGVFCHDIHNDGRVATYHVHPQYLTNKNTGIEYVDANNTLEGMYLYEPSSTLMKTGAWKSVKTDFESLLKLDVDSHLFVSDVLYPDFPGRISRICQIVDKIVKSKIKGTRLNVVTRNFPSSAEQIEKSLRLKPSDAGQFLYACRIAGKPTLLISNQKNLNPHDNTI